MASFDAAVSACTRAITSGRYSGSKLAKIFIDRGLQWSLLKGDYDHAIADFNEAIRIDPKNALAYSERGIAWSEKHDDDRALADQNTAIQIDPKNALAYTRRGMIWSYKDDINRAIADYSEAIQLDPKLPVAFMLRGNAWMKKQDFRKALAIYRACSLRPGRPKGDRARKQGFERTLTSHAAFRTPEASETLLRRAIDIVKKLV